MIRVLTIRSPRPSPPTTQPLDHHSLQPYVLSIRPLQPTAKHTKHGPQQHALPTRPPRPTVVRPAHWTTTASRLTSYAQKNTARIRTSYPLDHSVTLMNVCYFYSGGWLVKLDRMGRLYGNLCPRQPVPYS